jgi:D-alanyl-lipoteichoic acid acyltransferase DltB (MBOAT superfamily)
MHDVVSLTGHAAPTATLAGPEHAVPRRDAAAQEGPGRRISVQTFALILAQLALLVVVVDRFQIETEAFLRLTLMTVGGFAVHYFLPMAWRLPFFVGLSLGAIVMVLGLVPAAWLVAIGLGLIGLSHLPVNVYVRAGLLLLVGIALAVPRWGIGDVPWSAAIWPVLGSMFVFRMISYLYDRHHGVEPKGPSQTLAYFFLLPNVCFPLFPVIDFKRFVRSYYDAERHQIYQVGVEWIWRGVIQLLVYRLVYFHLTLDPVAVSDLADLAVYMLSTFLLYVRLSGYFHIVIGILHLFGFNLPETHHRYFLASSFTDFWRRINIYWKDFMMKVFYYPVYFQMRKRGDTAALVVATTFTFVATWLLHTVQWFWIRGSVLIEWNDILFWALFAALVLANSLREARHGRARTRQKRERTLGESGLLVAQTVGTFATICIMWSLWTAESTTDWLLMLRGAMHWPNWPAERFALVALALFAALALWVYGTWSGWSAKGPSVGPRISRQTILVTSVALCVGTIPPVTGSLGATGEIMDSVRLASATGLNRRDAENFQRGYYENLLDVGNFNRELQRSYEQMPADFVRSLSALGLTGQTGDEQDYEMLPLKSGQFMGALVQTNRWGFRDRDYDRSVPPHTYRLALVGPSTAMGSGVASHESFEAILEERLNREPFDDSGYQYEVLNFGVAGYSPLHVMYQLSRKVFAFDPKALLYLGHSNDTDRTVTQLARMVRKGITPPEPFLQQIIQETGLRPQTGQTEARRRLQPRVKDLQQWVYSNIVAQCRERSIRPVYVYLEGVTEPLEPWRAELRTEQIELARQAGFDVIDLTGVYEPYRPEDLWILKNDGHANALGNRLIGNRLYDRLRDTALVNEPR